MALYKFGIIIIIIIIVMLSDAVCLSVGGVAEWLGRRFLAGGLP